jgi:hypothetical protein
MTLLPLLSTAEARAYFIQCNLQYAQQVAVEL